MIHRFDKLAVELPEPDAPHPNAASAVQELLGGKFLGELTVSDEMPEGAPGQSCPRHPQLGAPLASDPELDPAMIEWHSKKRQ